jgi:hypothetical protein
MRKAHGDTLWQNLRHGNGRWPAAGFTDTELRWKMEPEVSDGTETV